MGWGIEMKRPVKPLDEFEMTCIVDYFGWSVSDALSGLNSAADERRLRDRARRFVLSHPGVTPEIARVFKKAVRERV